jgi:hypothetical protein
MQAALPDVYAAVRAAPRQRVNGNSPQ